jgi:D-alanine-D-alanine ligase-like ATP-grasp enzyme
LISNQHSSHYFKGTSLPCNNIVASKLSCNKYFLRRQLKEEGLPVPRTITLHRPEDWYSIMKSTMSFPLVVKPINASHANGASLNITSSTELKHAVEHSFSYIKENKKTKRVLVEEYFSGHDLRLLVVNNQVISVTKRDPAYVVGNGHSTIKQLILSFNKQWQSTIKYDFPICPIPLDNEVSRHLAKNRLTLNSVLPKGQKTYLRWNANVSTGGRPNDVTEQVNPLIKKLAVHVAKVAQLEVSGVDILCKDFTSNDISAKNLVILEINDSPGFDIHHFPINGTGQDVSTAILDHIFSIHQSPKEIPHDQVETLLKDIKIPATISI